MWRTTGLVRFSSQERPHFGAWNIGRETGNTFGRKYSHHDVTCICLEGELILGNRGCITNGCIICIRANAKVVIGNNFWMGHASKIISKESIEIGDNCQFSWECQIFDSDFHFMCDSNGKVNRFTRPTKIGNYVWLGNRVTVNKGGQIGNYSVVAGNSVVTKDFGNEDQCVYGGIPARKLKNGYTRVWYDKQDQIEKWFLEHPNELTCDLNEDI